MGNVRPDIEGMVRRGGFRDLIASVKGSDPDTMSDILDALVGMGGGGCPPPIPALRDAGIPDVQGIPGRKIQSTCHG
jgi:hypothetical protein